MLDPFIGEISTVGFNFAPQGWFLCNGQLLPIAQYTALFSLLGTTYGGDGKVTFGLPNIQSSVAVNQGNGPGLSPYVMGQAGGTETVTLNATQLPAHNHGGGVSATQGAGGTANPNNQSPGVVSDDQGNGINLYGPLKTGITMGMTVGQQGGNGPHPNLQPYLAVYYVIAWQGIFPQRP